MDSSFVHLNAQSAYSYLSGPSSVASLVLRAAESGQSTVTLTDTNSVTGVVELTRACRAAGIKPIGGAEVVLEGGDRLTLLMDGPTGWASLCRILSFAALRDIRRTGVRVRWEDIRDNTAGLVCLSGGGERGLLSRLVRQRCYDEALHWAQCLRDAFGRDNFAVEVTRTLTPSDRRVSNLLSRLAQRVDVPAVATNAVRYATKAEFILHEVLTRIRLGLAPGKLHPELPFNGERYLKSAAEMEALFPDHLEALINAALLAERLCPPLDPAIRHHPRYKSLPPEETATSYLTQLTWAGAYERFGSTLAPDVKMRLEHELNVIVALGYVDYFLVVTDLCGEARRLGIRYALRGSGVGSLVAYCLRVNEHDPLKEGVSFERFLTKARGGRAKKPDFDIDWTHEQRDRMTGYLRQTYGEESVAVVGTYTTFRARSLLRDIGKVTGFGTEEIEQLRALLGHARGDDLAERVARVPELRALGIDPARYADLFALCAGLAGLPRHLGTHSSGVVIGNGPLSSVCPLQWAAKGVVVTALDKDDVEEDGIGLIKLDQLSLRALSAIDLAVTNLSKSEPGFADAYAERDRDDEDTLAMIRDAETIGVTNLDSPAQQALQWKLKARRFKDVVVSVALIRPGPVLGNTVWAYLAHRRGDLAVDYALPELGEVLADTWGRIVYQDQATEVIRILGGFEDTSEADAFSKALRKAQHNPAETRRLALELRERAWKLGVDKESFQKLWRQVKNFVYFGFCSGHALAFGAHAQGTAWLLRHHPAEYLAALLSSEPTGFWPIHTVVGEAQRRSIPVLGPCINRSDARQWTVEEQEGTQAIRCSLAIVNGLGEAGADAIAAERSAGGPFLSLADLCRRCWFLPRDALECLTLAGALDALPGCEGNRRRALWALPALHRYVKGGTRTKRPESTGQQAFGIEMPPLLPPQAMSDFRFFERYAAEWTILGFSPQGHPMSFQREELTAQGILTCDQLRRGGHYNNRKASTGASDMKVRVAGLIVRPHRPPTAHGIVFFNLEDETGLAHVTVSQLAYERMGADIYGLSAAVVEGWGEQVGDHYVLRALEMVSLNTLTSRTT